MSQTPPVEMDGLRARYPEVFGQSLLARYGSVAALAGAVVPMALGLWYLGFTPWRMLGGISEMGKILTLMIPPSVDSWGKALIFLDALGETVAIALLGTFGAAVLALPFGLLAAKNVVGNRIVHFLARRSMDTVRGVDMLIYALVWINVVGLGPFAGVLAIMTSDLGTFGKLFSEAIEAADKKPVEGVVSTGGGAWHRIRFGLLPQVFPVMASQVLYYFESNTRSATIIGIVGAGGIGLHLAEQIRTLEFHQVAFIILMILMAVAAIDWISGKLRFAIIGKRSVALT
jgi:phosphonate transport system permease protein